jgi:hypothetical protein
MAASKFQFRISVFQTDSRKYIRLRNATDSVQKYSLDTKKGCLGVKILSLGEDFSSLGAI